MSKVSVVIPSYNHAAYLGEAVNSVLNQTLTDLELIVVDDGSTDRSLEILAGFSDSRMKVISQANQGAHAAINRGLKEARGEYLSILNSDDAYDPARLEKVISLFQADPNLGFVGTYIEIIDSQGKRLGIKHGYDDCPPWMLPEPAASFRAGKDLRAALLTENYWSTTSNYVFPRRLFEQAGEFRPLRYTHDWDFALRLAKVARMELLPEPLLKYRIHQSNTIRENQAAMIFEICWILAVHLPSHAGSDWFTELPADQRVDQLLHSIYTYDLNKVLAVMLVQNLAERAEIAEQLLDPDNETRRCYLDYIQTSLKKQADSDKALPQNQNFIRHTLKSAKHRVGRFLRR